MQNQSLKRRLSDQREIIEESNIFFGTLSALILTQRMATGRISRCIYN